MIDSIFMNFRHKKEEIAKKGIVGYAMAISKPKKHKTPTHTISRRIKQVYIGFRTHKIFASVSVHFLDQVSDKL